MFSSGVKKVEGVKTLRETESLQVSNFAANFSRNSPYSDPLWGWNFLFKEGWTQKGGKLKEREREREKEREDARRGREKKAGSRKGGESSEEGFQNAEVTPRRTLILYFP